MVNHPKPSLEKFQDEKMYRLYLSLLYSLYILLIYVSIAQGTACTALRLTALWEAESFDIKVRPKR